MKQATKLLLPILALASSGAFAQDSLAPHVHGEALLQVVQDGQELVVNLNSPAFNLLGFEHAPQDDQEQALLENLDTNMRDPQFWLELPAAANCSLSNVTLGQRIETTGHGEPDQEHEHEHEHEHDHEHEHEHEHEHDDHDHSEHRDLAYEYHFLCANPDSFEQARVTLFNHFPALTKLHAEVIGNSQSLQELTPSNPVLHMP